ncbi:uncharacterized protein LOC143227985 [Tachypleus tridentatus]|uniref:uncharacterized protein LOC143227985 n=1 Tax=Tachypleus tridentatus TaxID=6853 RepID=UPI003FD309C9
MVNQDDFERFEAVVKEIPLDVDDNTAQTRRVRKKELHDRDAQEVDLNAVLTAVTEQPDRARGRQITIFIPKERLENHFFLTSVSMLGLKMRQTTFFYVGICLLLHVCFGDPEVAKSKKIFSDIFGSTKFFNTRCQTDDQRDGTCYAENECTRLGGKPNGACASKYGVCCVFDATCGGVVRENNAVILSPNYPYAFTDSRKCEVIIQRKPNTCQVRLDFIEMTLAQPDNTICVKDRFSVYGNQNVPVICGENRNQHMYVDFGENDNLLVNVVTSGVSVERKWKIQVTYLECNSPETAPVGCLQYYKEPTGHVSSFNFESTNNNIPRHLGNLNYLICVKQKAGFCRIRWTAETFEISGSKNKARRGASSCKYDYVIIPNAFGEMDTTSYDRFCGKRLNTINYAPQSVPLTSHTFPFILRFVTNNQETEANKNRGFKMQYEQLPCVY